MKKTDPSQYTYCDSPFACAAAPIISHKWVPVIVCHLLKGPKRYNQLRRAIPALSAKVLAQNLRELESEGILTRHEVSRVAQTEVSYGLTIKGADLSRVILAMNTWGKKWLQKNLTRIAREKALPIVIQE